MKILELKNNQMVASAKKIHLSIIKVKLNNNNCPKCLIIVFIKLIS